MNRISTLYISYFGVREPLVQTQVLPYLRQLQHDGIAIKLLTFEPRWRDWSAAEQAGQRALLAGQGIEWRARAYHKWPSLPGTLYDIVSGAWTAGWWARREGVEVLHARGYVPAAMGALAKIFIRAKLLFDIRGVLAEEYVDAGVWPPGGLLFRLTKAAERRLLKRADGFVVLTERGRELLFAGAAETDGRPVEVIPCCVDAARFGAVDALTKAEAKRALGLHGRRVLAYVGALGGWYLTKELAEFLAFAHEQEPATFALILTQSPAELIAPRLQALGLAPQDFLVRQVPPAEIPRYLKAADAAISFIKPCYSKLFSSPTKVAEYLAAGLPVISNAGIGDLDALLEGDEVGVIVRGFDRAAYGRAFARLAELSANAELSARCRASAARRFDLEQIGGLRYRRLYRRLCGVAEDQPAAAAVTL